MYEHLVYDSLTTSFFFYSGRHCHVRTYYGNSDTMEKENKKIFEIEMSIETNPVISALTHRIKGHVHSSVMSGDNGYRMLMLLEEAIPDSSQENNENTTKTSHEFVDELVLPIQVDEMDLLNDWFDKFDEQICIPNEGYIKYEISSDGLIVLILNKEREEVVDKVRRFVEEHQVQDEEA